MPDPFPRVHEHYTIESLIGAGGMGEVYLATDERLGRRVAIKIVPESVGRDVEAKRRLLREARAAAALDHPNVCTVYEVGELEDRPYIVMQYVEGETLSDRMLRDRMTPAECVEVASQVCAALEEAHSRGIVHRDVKPMNIMITPRGQVKVLDFGLARFAAASDGATDVRSRSGVVSGTAPYMSPEQLRGGTIDARSDIFSVGVVMHEMANGRRPFDRGSVAATVTAILFEQAPALEHPDFAPLAPIIRRALRKDPADRYPAASEMLADLEAIRGNLRTKPRRAVSRALEPTERMAAAPAAPPKRRIDSIAVLPIVSGPLDPALEYLVHGLSEGITNALSHVRRLRVIASDTTARYAGSGIDPRDMGRELNVAAVAGVKARVDEQRLQAAVSLIGTADGALIWSSQYERTPREVPALAETIAEEIAERVRTRGSSSRRVVRKKRVVDAEAQQLFLKGRFQWIKRHPEAVKQAMALFQQAVERDPAFAMPYAGLADSFVMLGFIQALPPSEILPKVKAAAKRAIELDPLLADPHASLGYAAGLFEWDWETARRELEEAMRLNANYPWAPHWLGILYAGRGEFDTAVELIEISRSLDPLSPILNVGGGIPFHIARRYDEAVLRYRSVLETDPNLAPGHYYLAMALAMRGDVEEGVAEMRRAIEIAGPAGLYLGELTRELALLGRTAEANEVLEQLTAAAVKRYISPYAFAVAYTGLGRFDEAFDSFAAACAEHNAWIWFVPVDPRFDAVRADPRFAELMEKHGLHRAAAPSVPA